MARHLDESGSTARVAAFERPAHGGGKGLRRAAVSGTKWSLVQFGGSRAITMIVFLVLTHLLTPSAFGVVALANVFILFLQMFVEGGFNQAIIQRKNLLDGHADTVFWLSLTVSLALAGLLVGLAVPVSDLLDEPHLAPVLQVLSLGLVISALSNVQAALLRRALQFKSLAVRSVVGNLVGSAVGVAVAFLGAGVWALVVQYLVFSAIQTGTLWFLSSWRPGRDVSRRYLRDVFGYSRNSLANSVLAFTNTRSDDFLIGSRLGSVALGFYSVAYRLLGLMTDLINSVLLSVAFPVFARLQDDAAKLQSAFRSVLRTGLSMSFPAYLIFVVIAPDVTDVFFGHKWHDAAPVMRILAVFGAIQTGIAISESCINASGRPQWVVRNRLGNTLVQVVAFFIAAPFGIQWVAVSLVARAYLLLPILVWLLRKATIISFRGFAAALVVPAVSSLAMMGVLEVLYRFPLEHVDGVVRLVVAVPVGVVVYLGLTAVLDRQTLVEMVSMVRRRRGRGGNRNGRGAAAANAADAQTVEDWDSHEPGADKGALADPAITEAAVGETTAGVEAGVDAPSRTGSSA